MRTRSKSPLALRLLQSLASITIAASMAACATEPQAQILDDNQDNIASTSQAVQSLAEALSCVESYAMSNTCDWAHWTEMYLTCQTYAFDAMDNDDYLLDIVQSGACTAANWPAYSAIIEYRDSAPQTVTESLDCVSQFVSLNDCDWSHWTEMYLTCDTYAFSAMHDDDYLLDIVHSGECTAANWPQISALIDYRDAPPLFVDGLVSNVNENAAPVNFSSSFAATPAVFAAMQTFSGSDPADTRLGPIGTSSFGVFVQEEQSRDSEVAHAAEAIGFMALEPGAIIDENGYTIGEVGTLSLTQDDAGAWFTLNGYLGNYTSPVVIMMTNSVNGSHASHIRLKNVTSSSFSYQLEEWDYLDGTHGTETVAYMVVEAGSHRLPNGALLQATTRTIDHVSQSVSFPASHGATPVVLSQTQTVNGPASVVTRQHNVSTSSVNVRVQEQEADDGTHNGETVAVVSYGN